MELCKEKELPQMKYMFTSMLRMVMDNLTDASDYWTMTDKVRANISDGHCSARVTIHLTLVIAWQNLNRSGSC